MKAVATALFLLPFISHAQAGPADTTIRGVVVSFRYDVSIFPGSWQASPIDARGEQIAVSETGRCKSIMIKALGKYPSSVLHRELKAVYFLKKMKFYDVGYGGTNSNNALFLTNDGIDMGYTDLYLEQTFHHEFSSILFRNHPDKLDQQAWNNANIEGFDYNDPENGVGAIRNNQSSQELDTMLCRKGMLTQYACSGMENDINTYAQFLFNPSRAFWEVVDSYPRINRKTGLLIAFYNKINPIFTERFFRNLTR